MWWVWFVITFFVTTVRTDIVFRNCSGESFCAKFRDQVLDSKAQFYANVTAAERILNTVVVPLSNENGEELTLELSILFGHKLRIKVLQDGPFRYAPREILPLSKQDTPPDMEKSFDVVTVTTTSAIEDKFVVRSGPPFVVECYHQNKLEIVLNGDKLVMDNTDTSLAFSFTVEFEEAARLYGLGHHSNELALRQTVNSSLEPYRLKNVENFAGYDETSPLALYGSIPAVFGYSATHSEGVFLHNAAQMFVDISYTEARPSAYFMVECGIFDVIVFLGPTPRDVTRQYTSMTYFAPMPQLWTLGYHQNTYTTQNDIQDTIAKMDEADFPIDTIFFDYNGQHRYFQWNLENFPEPLPMQENISATGRRLVALSNSHIAVDLNYDVYIQGKQMDHYVKNPNGSDFRDLSYSGESVWVDFLSADARYWYSQFFWYKNFPNTTRTIAGFWIDIDQPAVFNNATEGTFPPEVLHFDQINNREIHNMYPLLHVKSINSGLAIRDSYETRLFVLSRSFFAKLQAYGQVWNGDNILSWSHLQNSISECLTLNLLGFLFCGAGIGNAPIDIELFQRWYQMYIWIPLFKANSNTGTFRTEPYGFSEDIQSVIRVALKTRYKHLPYLYRLFFDHSQCGDPALRPLFYSYPEYTDSDINDHILIGEDILSKPVLEPAVNQIQVTFPGNDNWYRIDDDSWIIYQGPTQQNVTVNITSSPYFYRAGSIIPRRDLERSSTAHMVNDPFQLYVNLDDDNNAVGLLYLDDYTSLEYRTKISFFYNRVIFIPDTNGLRFEHIVGNPDGFNVRVQRIIIHKPGENKRTITTTYTKTRDGTSLEDIDIVQQQQLMRGEDSFTLYL